MKKRIIVFDPVAGTGQPCGCNEEAMFIVAIYNHEIHMCSECMAKLGKEIIDGLL